MNSKTQLEEIIELYNTAKSNNDLEFGIAQALVARLHSLPLNIRKEAKDFYDQIGHDLIERQINLSNYNPESFYNKKDEIVEVQEDEIEFEDLIKKSFEPLSKCLIPIENVLKRYILLYFGDSKAEQPTYLILHDKYSSKPFFQSIKTDLEPNICEINDYEDFIKEVLMSSSHSLKKQYVCILILSPDPLGKLGYPALIETIWSLYSNHMQILIEEFTPTLKFEIEDDKSKIIEEINYLVKTDMSNIELIPSQEKIVKKILRKQNFYSIAYEILTGGFSGSKVIKVIPYEFLTYPTKYVIKINNINNLKIKEEADKFETYVKGRAGNNYSIDTDKTEKYRAIRYNYASDDNSLETKSFSDYTDDYSSDIHNKVDLLLNYLDKIYSIKLFERWKPSMLSENIFPVKYYLEYINIDEILKIICTINEITIDEAREHPVMVCYKNLDKEELKTKTKYCHGDLHSKNIFIDEKENCFVIDFGDTGRKHATIDQSVLECSIKFNHIPRYIPIDELMSMEEELLQDCSLDTSFSLKKNYRNDVKAYFKIIQKIRQYGCKNNHETGSQTEYLISLFIITLRQLRYSNLNQLYAFKSADLIASYLSKNLNYLN